MAFTVIYDACVLYPNTLSVSSRLFGSHSDMLIMSHCLGSGFGSHPVR